VYSIANLSHHNFVYMKKSGFLIIIAVERICKYLNIKPKLQGAV